ncbi:MAG: YlxM family DNA-binding protein [Negativicutes bacterium]|nr:YlxM family DNA-binding protein [Negativicutes bacterium]
MLAKVLRIGQLYDFYGALLTDKQRQCLEMHYLNDLSLAEIADEFQVSRQAIHDILRRGELILEEYEAKLGLVDRYRQEQESIRQAFEMLNDLPHDFHRLRNFGFALDLLKQLLDREEEG